MKYFGMTGKGLYIYIYIGGLSTIDNVWHHFTSFKITHFSDEKTMTWHPGRWDVRSARRSSKIQRASWQISVPGPLGNWGRKTRKTRGTRWRVSAVAFLSVWLEISISTIKTSWKAKHVSHRIVCQKGNMDPFHSFESSIWCRWLFIVPLIDQKWEIYGVKQIP